MRPEDPQLVQLLGQFVPVLFQHPLPENIRITLDVDRNDIVKAVSGSSPAQRAGIMPGDAIVRAGSIRVLTTADLQFALNSVPDKGTVTLETHRDGRPLPPRVLRLPRGWRRTDISWRASQGDIPPTVGIWAEPLSDDQKRQRGIAADRMALRVSFLFPGSGWARTRGDLKMDDVIVGINGQRLPEMNARQFHSYFRLHFNVGDAASLNILRGDRRLEISVPCLAVGDEA